MVENHILKRLAFIKYLFTIGHEQSKQHEPLCAVSVLTWHDCIELFLFLANEQLNAGNPPFNIMDYWDLLNKKLTTQLSQKEAMRRLVKSRVALKHHGTMPSKLDLEAFRETISSFMTENTPNIFDMLFDDISLVDLVKYEIVREWLTSATKALNDNDSEKAAMDVAVAFKKLLEEYQSSKDTGYTEFPFSVTEDFTWDSFYLSELEEGEKLRGFFDKITRTFESIQNAMTITLLGLDYRKYSFFRIIVPSVSITQGGDIRWAWTGRSGNPTLEESQFCFNFVLESALKLQDFDYKLPKYDSASMSWK